MGNIRSFFTVILVTAVTVYAFCIVYPAHEFETDIVKEQEIMSEYSGAAAYESAYNSKEGFKEYKCPELGFLIRVPCKMNIDNTLMPAFVRISGSDMDIKISRENSPYKDIDGYFNTYLYKYMLDHEYLRANDTSLICNEYKDINGIRTRILEFARRPAAISGEDQSEYTHGLFITGDREFYSCFIRCCSLSKQKETIEQILRSFRRIESSGDLKFSTAFGPELPEWNDETAAFYKKLADSDSIMWGIFYPDSITKDFSKIEALEKKLDYEFPITLHYIYLGHKFPMEGMRNAYHRGKTAELTMQVMWNVEPGNTDNEKKNVNFDLIDGLYDDYLRKFARDAKAFGHPFIFRLNNEMNSTWVRYSGIALLCDPDVYIKVWRHIYGIFEEEGVKNAIWVFNPNDADYPPLKWNSHISYYPGNKYVHIVGLTGYNTGTYYSSLTGEKWRGFTEIYDPLNERYSKFYSKFPWMITEFACSSIGGDKEKWIRDMFANIKRYKNIKAAVWWSYADFDYGRGKEGIPARRYWLDEKPEYIKAFKEGLRN